jgi:hypothetical protein
VQARQAHPKRRRKPRRVPRPASGFHGVRANGKRWKSTICYVCKANYLGTFATKEEAALTYDREARQCGEDKPLNYESTEASEEAAVQSRQAPALVRACVCVCVCVCV